jgi:hypothetical protein
MNNENKEITNEVLHYLQSIWFRTNMENWCYIWLKQTINYFSNNNYIDKNELFFIHWNIQFDLPENNYWNDIKIDHWWIEYKWNIIDPTKEQFGLNWISERFDTITNTYKKSCYLFDIDNIKCSYIRKKWGKRVFSFNEFKIENWINNIDNSIIKNYFL